MEIAYDGTNYHGWQKQPNALGVQQVIEDSLSTILRIQIAITGSGRTDSGVHCSQQYAHFDVENEIPSSLLNRLNGLLPNDIVIFRIVRVKEEAHARFDAKCRSYVYHINMIRSPFGIQYSYFYSRSVDLDSMNEAAKCLLEHQDFTSFSKVHTDTFTNNCKITKAHWVKTDLGFDFHISADRFLRGMVRAIVGTLLEVGLGRITKEEFNQIILGKNRNLASANAPAHGLFLCEVGYPEDVFIE